MCLVSKCSFSLFAYCYFTDLKTSYLTNHLEGKNDTQIIDKYTEVFPCLNAYGYLLSLRPATPCLSKLCGRTIKQTKQFNIINILALPV